MNYFYKVLLITGCGIVVLSLLVYIAGSFLPAQHTIVRKIQLRQSPDSVFDLLADIVLMPQWTRNTQKVVMLAPVEGREVTRQTFKGGMTMTITTSESVRPNKL